MTRIRFFYSLFIISLYSCGSVNGQVQEINNHGASPRGIKKEKTFSHFASIGELKPLVGLKISYPECIQKRIDEIKQQPIANPPIEIYQATYNGKFIYHITAPCCDMYTTLVDENCKTICHPSGGITGKGDLKCGDILEKITARKLIWKDQRKSKKK